MFPFNFGHRKKAVDEFFVVGVTRITRSGFVFTNVVTLQTARAIHRRQPTHQMTKYAEHTSQKISPKLTQLPWLRTELLEHLTDQLAMMPLFVFDLPNSMSLLRILH